MIDRRVCTVCNVEKSFDEFHKSKKGKWGIREQCKICKRVKDRLYDSTHTEICTAKHARWANKHREHVREYCRARYAENPEPVRQRTIAYRARTQNASIKAYKKRFPNKLAAHRYVELAVKFGHLVRPEKCDVCSAGTNIQAHHHDYDKPLEVQWLCSVCHGLQHRRPRKKMLIEPERASEKTREGCGALDSMET
jgi:hypothetical protein